MEIRQLLFLLYIFGANVSGQLIGFRGVIPTLPEGQQYRDPETVRAATIAGRFAKDLQRIQNQKSARLRYAHEKDNYYIPSPQFYTYSKDDQPELKRGRDIFDFKDSRYLDPLPETRFNKPLESLEAEREEERRLHNLKQQIDLNPPFSSNHLTFPELPRSGGLHEQIFKGFTGVSVRSKGRNSLRETFGLNLDGVQPPRFSVGSTHDLDDGFIHTTISSLPRHQHTTPRPYQVTTPLPYKYETLITPRELYSHSTPAPYSHSTPAPYSHSTPAPYSHSTPAPIFTTPSPFLHSAPSYHSRPSRPGPYTAEKDRFEFKKELPYVSSLPKTQYGPNHLGGGHIETSDVGHFGILTGSHLGNSGGSHIGISGGSHLGNPSSSVQSANYGNKEFITHTEESYFVTKKPDYSYRTKSRDYGPRRLTGRNYYRVDNQQIY